MVTLVAYHFINNLAESRDSFEAVYIQTLIPSFDTCGVSSQLAGGTYPPDVKWETL